MAGKIGCDGLGVSEEGGFPIVAQTSFGFTSINFIEPLVEGNDNFNTDVVIVIS